MYLSIWVFLHVLPLEFFNIMSVGVVSDNLDLESYICTCQLLRARCSLKHFMIVTSLSFESLFGGSSRGAQLPVYFWPENLPPLSGKVRLVSDQSCNFGRNAHGAMREEGDTSLASQISRINLGDWWGDRCGSQIALTSISLVFYAHPMMEVLLFNLIYRLGYC